MLIVMHEFVQNKSPHKLLLPTMYIYVSEMKKKKLKKLVQLIFLQRIITKFRSKNSFRRERINKMSDLFTLNFFPDGKGNFQIISDRQLTMYLQVLYIQGVFAIMRILLTWIHFVQAMACHKN